MTRWEAWLNHITAILLTATGIAYAWMHYMMKSPDPFSVINHPWEPYMLDFHILIAPVVVLLTGLLVRSHIIAKLESNGKTSRKSGILMIPLFIVMVVSGYLLQVITASWKNALVMVHLASGILWFLFYIGHYLSSMSLRKLMRASAAFASDQSATKETSQKLQAVQREKPNTRRTESEKR